MKYKKTPTAWSCNLLIPQISWTHKSVSWPKEDIVSGMLPVNWLSESDLHKEKIISPLMSTMIYGPFNAFTWKSLFLEAHLWI